MVYKEWSPRLRVDTSSIEHVQMLVESSPDFAIDMAVMSWVQNKREWFGKYKDWTDLPIDWFAKKCHCRYQRIVDSIDRLIAMGIIRPMRPERMVHKVMKYIYVKIKPKPDEETYEGLDDESRIEKIQAEMESLPPIVKEEEVIPEKPVTAAVNPIKKQAVPTVEVLYWDGERMIKKPTLLSEAINYPKCELCGQYMHPHEGIYARDPKVCCLDFLIEAFNDIDSEDKAVSSKAKARYYNIGFTINNKSIDTDTARKVMQNALKK